MTRIGVVVGSTRPGRQAEKVGTWFQGFFQERHPFVDVRLLDLLDFDLPLLDEQHPAALGSYEREHTRTWACAVESCDGFVFVTPEYNHSTTAALKNSIDFLFAEWNDKAAGLVTYGVAGGLRAAEHLRQILAEVKVACVRTSVGLSLDTDFDNGGPAPRPQQEAAAERMTLELLSWSAAFVQVREQ